MTTIVHRRSRQVAQKQSSPPEVPLGRRRRRWIAPLALLGVLLLWLSPAIVAHTALFRWVLAEATGRLGGTATVGGASLGWFSPIRLSGVEVRDPQGELVLETARLVGEKSLAATLWDLSRPGRFRLEAPRLNLVLRPQGSNLEDLLGPYLAVTEDSSGGTDLEIEVVDGSIAVSDSRSGETWQIDQLQLAVCIPAERAKPFELRTSGTVTDQQPAGRFDADLTFLRSEQGLQTQTPGEGSASGQPPGGIYWDAPGRLTINTEAVPLAMFQSLLVRFAPDVELAGRFDSQIECKWGDEKDAQSIVFRAGATASDFLLAAPPLGPDRVLLASLGVNCHLVLRAGRLEVEKLAVDSDVGNASLVAALELGQPAAARLPADLLRQDCRVEGRIDLARLAQMLPHTLHVQPQTKITSGDLQVALSSHPGPEGMVWEGQLETSNLTAINNTQRLVWEKPIRVELAARQDQKGAISGSLQCRSNFLELHAEGTAEQMAGRATLDLNRLAAELEKFVDLEGLRLAGRLWAYVNYRRSKQQSFDAKGELQFRDFQLAAAGRQPWSEDNLLVFLSAAGQTDFSPASRLEAAAVEIRSGQDRCLIRLTGPVAHLENGGEWPLEVQVWGDLERWLARTAIKPLTGDWLLAGASHLHGNLTCSAATVEVHQAELSVKDFRMIGGGLSIVEPVLKAAVSGRWSFPDNRLELRKADLTGGGLSVQAGKLVLAASRDAPFELVGDLACRAELERVQQWTTDPANPPRVQLAGHFAGEGRFEQSSGVTSGRIEATVRDLSVANSTGEQLRQALVRLVAGGSYEHQARLLDLQQLDLSGDGLGYSGRDGRIVLGGDKTDLELAGQVSYDWQKASGLLRTCLGQRVQIVGRGSGPVSYRGPLTLAEGQGEAAVDWATAAAYGFRLGRGRLTAGLSAGMLRMQLVEVELNEGRLSLAPRVRLAPEPMELHLEAGPLAQRVQIDPQMCASALKYIAPVLAGVATAEGRFSVELDACRIPLADAAKGDLAGRFIVHSVEVGPGPLVQELALLLGRASPAKLARESVVKFHMADGRIHHQGLEMVFPEVTIRTYGSVGLDQTLAIVAEMPIPPKWLGNNPLRSAMRDQTIRLPVSGTLQRPRIDRAALRKLSRQFIRDGARSLLEEEINRGLERLLGPRK